MAQKRDININLLIYAGLAVGGYFAITQVLKGLGFMKSDEQKAAEKLQNKEHKNLLMMFKKSQILNKLLVENQLKQKDFMQLWQINYMNI